ncbi:MAG TPA: CDP-alcohol phosphatidyltransferase family protein [Candidatus Kryptonia bacterium]|nr:CDP-alcohol phosphatidyltransferase family protein [Candidatus Kryptonia bacterium]
MLTLPNFLTMLRIVGIPVFLILLTGAHYGGALVLFVVAALTDTIDGALARIMDSRSELGAILDPLADKLLQVSTFIVLTMIGAIPYWLLVIVLSRDVVILLGYLTIYLIAAEPIPVDPSGLGKASTFFQLFTIGFTVTHLARPDLPMDVGCLLMQYCTAVTSGTSGLHYVYTGLLYYQRGGAVTKKEGV